MLSRILGFIHCCFFVRISLCVGIITSNHGICCSSLTSASSLLVARAEANYRLSRSLFQHEAIVAKPSVSWSRRSALLAAFGISSPVLAASNKYDFGYRLEKTLDPNKYGPATGDVDSGPNELQKIIDAQEGSLLKDFDNALTALLPLPALLEESKWKEASVVLGQLPVTRLWKTPEEENPIRTLALLKDSYTVGLSDRLLRLADRISDALRLIDEFTYANTKSSQAYSIAKNAIVYSTAKDAIYAIKVARKIGSGPFALLDTEELKFLDAIML